MHAMLQKLNEGLQKSYLELFKEDVEAVDFLKEQTKSSAKLVDLTTSASKAFNANQSRRTNISIHLYWVNDDQFRIDVGGRIDLNDDGTEVQDVTYYICVSKYDDDSSKFVVCRKFHFDYACPSDEIKRKSNQPILHLQSPGTLPPALKKSHVIPEACCEWLETPRILFFPMSLALTVQLAFTEFPSESTRVLASEGAWLKRHVVKDERKLFPSFMAFCQASQESKNRCIFSLAHLEKNS